MSLTFGWPWYFAKNLEAKQVFLFTHCLVLTASENILKVRTIIWICAEINSFFLYFTESYTIVYPEVVENRAGIVINDVKSYVRRRKRTLGTDHKPLEISISGGGQIFDLELWENDNLFAPGFKIYHRQTLKQAQAEKEQLPHEDILGCHFTGHLRERVGNTAAISICNGLVSSSLFLCHFLCQGIF